MKPEQQDTLTNLIKQCRNSSFSKHSYCVNIELRSFIRSLYFFIDQDDHETISSNFKNDDKNFNLNLMKKAVPDFQRENTKWNKKMKVKFIENVLKGAKVEFMFFRMSEYGDSQIIDGLQRLTAILDFFHGKVLPFGLSYKDIEQEIGKFRDNIHIKIYTFDNWAEVGKFYVDMNENITHSKSDIQKAKDWFLKEKSTIII